MFNFKVDRQLSREYFTSDAIYNGSAGMTLYYTSRGNRRCPRWPMAKPDSNFVYHITKEEDKINCGNVSECNMRHVMYERVHNLRKSTHVQEEEGSIVNELNVFFDN
jgi:hypothetical protein